MKVSIRQILASAAGAVVAATIASFFGVSGTIVGVAIGSMAATIGTALVAHSLDRTHHAVVQAAVRAPESSLLRRIGGTTAEGAVTETVPEAATPVTEQTASSRAREGGRLVTGITSPGPATAALPRTSTPVDTPWRLNWRLLAVTAVIVFVVALGVITVFELISGRPLSNLVGGQGSGLSILGGTNGTTTTTVPPTTTTTTTTTVPRATTTTTTPRATTSTTGVTTTSPTSTTVPVTSTSLPAATSKNATTTTRPG